MGVVNVRPDEPRVRRLVAEVESRREQPVVASFDADRPARIDLVGKTRGQFQFQFLLRVGWRKNPFLLERHVEGRQPFVGPAFLQHQFLLQFEFVAVVGRFAVNQHAKRFGVRIQQLVFRFGRNPLEFKPVFIRPAGDPLAVRAREIQVAGQRQLVREAVFQFLAEIPRGKDALGLVSPVGEPLFEFASAFGQHLRLLHVGEQAFIGAKEDSGQQGGSRQRTAARAVRATRQFHFRVIRFNLPAENRRGLFENQSQQQFLLRTGLRCKRYFVVLFAQRRPAAQCAPKPSGSNSPQTRCAQRNTFRHSAEPA